MEYASVAITTVHAVTDVIVREKSLMGMLGRVIRWGGDTDSVAVIAWGIASARFRGEKLPEFLERDLEGGNATTGADYLRQTGAALMARFA
jgi:ADP-ribosylglycohydrolase